MKYSGLSQLYEFCQIFQNIHVSLALLDLPVSVRAQQQTPGFSELPCNGHKHSWLLQRCYIADNKINNSNNKNEYGV